MSQCMLRWDGWLFVACRSSGCDVWPSLCHMILMLYCTQHSSIYIDMCQWFHPSWEHFQVEHLVYVYMHHICCLLPFPSSLPPHPPLSLPPPTSLSSLSSYLPPPTSLQLIEKFARSNTGILGRFGELSIGCVWCIDWDCHFKLVLEVFTDQNMYFSTPFPFQT